MRTIAALSIVALCFSSVYAQSGTKLPTAQTGATETYSAKANQIVADCDRMRADIPGIYELDKKLPGSAKTLSLTELNMALKDLPDQESKPSEAEIAAAVATIKISVNCRGKLLDYFRPLQSPIAIAYLETAYYFAEVQSLFLLSNGATFHEINLARFERTKRVKDTLPMINKAIAQRTKESLATASKIVTQAEQEFTSLLEEYDQRVAKMKAAGYKKCQPIAAFEFCSK